MFDTSFNILYIFLISNNDDNTHFKILYKSNGYIGNKFIKNKNIFISNIILLFLNIIDNIKF